MTRPVDIPAAGERIAKLLARAGIASRREIERYIAEGRIARDGVVIDTPATVLASLDGVTVDGTPVAQPAPARLFLHHKPTGLLVTERDPRGRPTIYDRLPPDLPRVVPVGRLDLNTEGLLLLTTDGGLKRQLELPATGVERAYRARCYGQVSQAQLETLMEGIEIDGVRYGPINANLERRTGANTWIEMILTEGKNREVRRVLEHLGLQVGRLIRTRYGPFILADLPPGAVGEVRQADLVAFRQTLGGRRRADEARIAVSPPAKPTPAQMRPAGRSQTAGSPRQMRDPGEPQATVGSRRGQVAVQSDRKAPTSGQRGGSRATLPATPDTLPPGRSPTVAQRASSGQGEPSLDPGLRRGGVRTTNGTKPAPVSVVSRANPHKRTQTEPAADAVAPPRPARIERKTGWAKPKPKTGPRRPGKR
ncbi:MAG: pseudouridine synthase [Sphingomonas bacterium]|uniref:pseudouridine synthase n=1 Tax=Sphingomonas bacterium TaxID=1895847 RepID=UPI002601C19D|nr:pseudouridine synthase [Sphingomonas bacterium]MDB5695762.1 pseudouridine synthase [Sphingomonas bacterium]